jgi:hypothetical protein
MNKQLFALLSLLVIASMALSACGGTATQTEPPPATKEPVTFITEPVVTEAPVATQAPVATEAPTAQMPEITYLACTSVTPDMVTTFTVEIFGEVEAPNSQFCEPTNTDSTLEQATFLWGEKKLSVTMYYSGSHWGWGNSQSNGLIESNQYPSTTDSTGNIKTDRIAFSDPKMEIVVTGRLMGAPKGCGYAIDTYYGHAQGVAGHGVTVYYADNGTVTKVLCTNGTTSFTKYITISDVAPSQTIYFSTGNECTASENGKGIKWLDLHTSGEHLRPPGQTGSFQNCQYLWTATPK